MTTTTPTPALADLDLDKLEQQATMFRDIEAFHPGHFRTLKIFASSTLDLIALARRAAQPAEGAGQAGQVAMTADELAALRRFYECAADGEGYDVPKPMMRRLSEIGVVQRISGAYYHTTEYGLAVLDSAERAAAPADRKVDGVANWGSLD